MHLRKKRTLKYSKLMMINSRVPELIATVNNNSRDTESVKTTFKSFLLQSEIMESYTMAAGISQYSISQRAGQSGDRIL
jgi:hypothetical protein